jgi:hypothetical protein
MVAIALYISAACLSALSIAVFGALTQYERSLTHSAADLERSAWATDAILEIRRKSHVLPTAVTQELEVRGGHPHVVRHGLYLVKLLDRVAHVSQRHAVLAAFRVMLREETDTGHGQHARELHGFHWYGMQISTTKPNSIRQFRCTIEEARSYSPCPMRWPRSRPVVRLCPARRCTATYVRRLPARRSVRV